MSSNGAPNLLHLVLIAIDEENRYVGGQEKALNLKLSEDGYGALLSQGLRSKVTLQVPPGRYRLKAVVRESVDAILGSAQRHAVVPKRIRRSNGPEEERPLLDALTSPNPLTQLGLKFQAYVFAETPQQARLILAGRVKNLPAELSFQGSLRVMGVARSMDGRIASLFSDSVELGEQEKEISFRNDLKLAPGRYRVKLAVVDPGGRRGTAEEEVLVPAFQLDSLTASSLLLSQKLEGFPAYVLDLQRRLTDETDPLFHNGVRILAPAERRFESSAPLAVFYKVHNLKSDLRERRLTAKVTVRNEKGQGHEYPPFLLKQGVHAITDGEATVAFRLPTEELPPGTYRLVVETQDISNGQSVVAQAEMRILQGSRVEDSAGNGQLNVQDANLPQPTRETLAEGIDYLAITQAEDLVERLRRIEAFIAKYPGSDRIATLSEMATLLYWRLQKFDKVIEHGENTLALRPSSPRVLSLLATAHHLLDQPDQVIRRASKAIRSLRNLDKPGYLDEARWKSQIDDLIAKNYAYMGSAYFSQYESDRRKPDNDEASLKLDKAYTYSSRAVELNPNSDFAHFQLGLVFCARNLVADALYSLARAVVLGGAFVDTARENLELVYKSFNQGSSEGLDEVLEQARADLVAKADPSL